MNLIETKWLVSGSAFIVLLVRRDAATVTFLCGAIGNALLSKVLKRLINAARPAGARLSDPGMPSSHAQSLSYFAVFLALGAETWEATLPPRLLHLLRPLMLLSPPLLRHAGAALSLALGAALTALRVRAGLHTPAQCAVGAAIGGLNGACCFFTMPACVLALQALQARHPVALVGGVLLLGAAVVGSVERTLAARMKDKKT